MKISQWLILCPCSYCQQDPRFNKEVDRQTGYHTKSLLCKPVKNNEGEVSQSLENVCNSPLVGSGKISFFFILVCISIYSGTTCSRPPHSMACPEFLHPYYIYPVLHFSTCKRQITLCWAGYIGDVQLNLRWHLSNTCSLFVIALIEPVAIIFYLWLLKQKL